MVGSSARCFSSGEVILKIIMTVSYPGKGTILSSLGASTTSMTSGKDPVAMKLFIRLQSQSLRLTA
jgi:hypothetical protein